MGVENHRAFITLQNHVKSLLRDTAAMAGIGQRQGNNILKLLEMLKATEARILVLEGASGLTEEDLKRGYTKAMERLDEVERDVRARGETKNPPPFNAQDFGDPG